MNITALFSAIKAVCPVESVSVGNVNDKTTWRIDFAAAATPQQRAAAQSALDAFDPNTPEETRRDIVEELDESKAMAAALLKKGAITRQEIDAEKRK